MAKKGHGLTKVVWPTVSSGPLPREAAKIGRNDPCPCGSGKKYKACHADEGDKFLARLARQQRRERVRELRRQLKEQGVPWYRRIFV